MEDEFLIALVAIVSLFVVFPALVMHYITLWRKQKTLLPDDERMLEDLWRSARNMERRIETMEKLIASEDEDDMDRPSSRRSTRSRFED